jgi:hypothetical protein
MAGDNAIYRRLKPLGIDFAFDERRTLRAIGRGVAAAAQIPESLLLRRKAIALKYLLVHTLFSFYPADASLPV